MFENTKTRLCILWLLQCLPFTSSKYFTTMAYNLVIRNELLIVILLYINCNIINCNIVPICVLVSELMRNWLTYQSNEHSPPGICSTAVLWQEDRESARSVQGLQGTRSGYHYTGSSSCGRGSGSSAGLVTEIQTTSLLEVSSSTQQYLAFGLISLSLFPLILWLVQSQRCISGSIPNPN